MYASRAASGAVERELRYDPFGVLVAGELDPAEATAYGFAGRELDLSSGLYYHHARYRDPVLGRFLPRTPRGCA